MRKTVKKVNAIINKSTMESCVNGDMEALMKQSNELKDGARDREFNDIKSTENRANNKKFQEIRNSMVADGIEFSKDVVNLYFNTKNATADYRKAEAFKISPEDLQEIIGNKQIIEDTASINKSNAKKHNGKKAFSNIFWGSLSFVSLIFRKGVYLTSGEMDSHGRMIDRDGPLSSQKAKRTRHVFMTAFEPYKRKADALEREILNNYDLIMKNKNEMKKKEFEEWKNGFVRDMLVRVEAQCAQQAENEE